MSNLSFLKEIYVKLHKIRHINWEKLDSYTCVNQFAPGGSEWDQILRDWLEKAGSDLGNYILYESDNFFLLSGETEKVSKLILNSAEKSIAYIRNIFGDDLEEERWRIVLILFSKPEKHLDYLEYYTKDFLSTRLAGVFIENAGYQHITLGPNDMLNIEMTVAHELTHYILSPFQLPLWMDEGFAVNIAKYLYGEQIFITYEDHKKLKAFGTAENIEKFLSGEAFSEFDPKLTYGLAELLVNNLLNYEKKDIVNLIKNVSWEDGGVSGFKEQFGIDLKNMISQGLS